MRKPKPEHRVRPGASRISSMRTAPTLLLVPLLFSLSAAGQDRSRAPSPSSPVALEVLFPPTDPRQRNYDDVQQYLLSKSSPAFPLVAGAVLRVEWSDFDLGDATVGTHTKYDFKIVDEIIAPWLAAGKTANLVLHAVPYAPQPNCPERGIGSRGESGVGNCAVPAWMWTALGESNYVSCDGTRAPNFLAAAYQSNYQAAITALVKHYPGNSGIGYIRVGLGKGGEINLPRGWQDPSTPCGEAYTRRWGYTIGDSGKPSWNAYLQKMLEFEGTLTASKQLMVSITPVHAPGVNPQEVSEFIAPIAVKNGIGFGNQGLSAQSMRDCTGMEADWCALFDRFQGKVPLELQTLGRSCPAGAGQCSEGESSDSPRPRARPGGPPWPGRRWPGPGPGAGRGPGASGTGRGRQGPVTPEKQSSITGSLVPLLPFAVQHHATILEIYCEDWLIAFSPNHPEHEQYGADYADALKRVAAKGN